MHNGDTIWSKRQSYRLSQSMKWCLLGVSISSALIALTLFIVTIIKYNELVKLRQHEQQLMHEVAELDTLNGQKKLLEDAKQQLEIRLNKIQKITCISKNNPYQYLRVIERIIPERVVLKNFIFDRTTIKLEGLAYTVQEVTMFMRALAQSKLVASPQLRALDRGKKKNKKEVKTAQEVATQKVVAQETATQEAATRELPEGTVRFIIDVTKN